MLDITTYTDYQYLYDAAHTMSRANAGKEITSRHLIHARNDSTK